jgi:hypothetical protein
VARKQVTKLSAEKLKEKGLAWVPKGSIQAQKDDAQASGATKAKERKRFKKQLLNWRFVPNHQNQWAWHHPYSLPMPMWNSSPGMHGYPLAPYFFLVWIFMFRRVAKLFCFDDQELKYLF